jgi:tyrosine-protein kinase Etk/Wzc
LQTKIADWQLELATLQDTYTDKHYRVVELKQRIREAQNRLHAEIANLVEERSINPISEWENLVQQAVSLYVQLKGFEHRETLAASRIEQFRKEHPDLLDKEVQLVRLEREARIREKTYMLLMDRYEEMLLLKQVGSREFSIVDSAIPPGGPIAPRKMRIIIAGLLVGLVMGVAAAFFLEYMDDSIKQGQDVEQDLRLPVVGLIPKIHVAKARLPVPESSQTADSTEADIDGMQALSKSGQPEASSGETSKRRRRKREREVEILQGRLVGNVGISSPTAESYRSLWVNIQYAGVDREVKTILVTSPGPREGKSLTVANLASIMAQSGVKVLVVDADLRRPTIHSLFGYKRAPGLSELMSGESGNINEYAKNTYVDNLYVLTCGKTPPNPVGILGSEKMKKIIEEAREQFDVVLFDSPPLVAMADASVLASELDTTILVLRVGQTKLKIASQAREMLERLDIDVFGAVLNNMDYSRRYSPYYYYYHHYKSYYSREKKDEI